MRYTCCTLVPLLVFLSPSTRAAEPVPEAQANGKPLSHWVKRLKDADAAARIQAAEALGTIGDQAKPAVTALARALEDAEPCVRRQALQALQNMGPDAAKGAIEAVAKALDDAEPRTRMMAALTLIRLDTTTKTPLPIIKKLLADRDSDPTDRALAAQVLAEMGPRAADLAPLVLELIGEGEGATNYNLPGALNNFGPFSAVKLIDHLNHRDEQVRLTVHQTIAAQMWNLVSLSQAVPAPDQADADQVRKNAKEAKEALESFYPLLLKCIGDENENVAATARSALTAYGVRALPDFFQAAEGKDARLRFSGVQGIASIGLNDADRAKYAKLLQTLSKDPEQRIRDYAVAMLPSFQPPAPAPDAPKIPDLIAKLADKDDNAWWTAIYNLHARQKEALSALEKATRHDDPRARAGAIRALASLTGDGEFDVPNAKPKPLAKEWLDALARGLADPDAKVRAATLEVLNGHGRFATSLLDAVVKALDDKDMAVRNAAANAVPRVGRGSKKGIDALTKMLKDKDVRQNAAGALANYGKDAKSAIPALMEAMDANSLGDTVSYTLGNFGPDELLGPCREALKSDQASRRAIGAHLLARFGEASKPALPELTKLVMDADAIVRQQAASALYGMGKAAADAIPSMLASDDDNVRSLGFSLVGTLGSDGLPMLLKSLKDVRPQARVLAVQQLGNLAASYPALAKEVVPPIVAVVKEEKDANTRQAAVAALMSMGSNARDAAGIFAATLASDKDENVRYQAVCALCNMGEGLKGVAPQLAAALKDTNASVRMYAVMALGNCGAEAKDAVAPLAEMLGTADDSIYPYVIQTLGKIGGPAVADLVKGVASDNARTKEGAIQALAAMGPKGKDAAAPMAKLLADANQRPHALRVLAGLGAAGKEAVPEVVKLVSHQDANVSQAALNALANLGPEAVAPFKQALKHTDANLRARAFAALAQVTNQSGGMMPVVLEALADADAGVCGQALQALGRIPWDDPAAIYPKLRDVLGNPNDFNRAAVVPLLQARGADALPVLIPLLQHRDAGTRREVAIFLSQFSYTKQAVPALREALKDSDTRVRIHAAHALWLTDQQRTSTSTVLQDALKSKDQMTRRDALQVMLNMEGGSPGQYYPFGYVPPRFG